MKKASIAAIALIIILLLVNTDVFLKEQQLANGKVVILALAPVDPRSIMQGDYMTLRFAVATDIEQALVDKSIRDGFAVLNVDDLRRGHFVRLYENQPLQPQEMLLYFRLREAQVKIASEAFFFEEGAGLLFGQAKFALLRVNKNHRPLLVELLDAELNTISADQIKR